MISDEWPCAVCVSALAEAHKRAEDAAEMVGGRFIRRIATAKSASPPATPEVGQGQCASTVLGYACERPVGHGGWHTPVSADAQPEGEQPGGGLCECGHSEPEHYNGVGLCMAGAPPGDADNCVRFEPNPPRLLLPQPKQGKGAGEEDAPAHEHRWVFVMDDRDECRCGAVRLVFGSGSRVLALADAEIAAASPAVSLPGEQPGGEGR